MSDYTSKLNLYKVDPTIDGEEKFNIKTMMNNNWDKIDTKVSEIDQKLSGIEDNANNYKHPSTHNADMINIQDADGKFSSGNVEGALQEVGASMADIAYKTVGGTANAITVSKQGFTLIDGQYVEFKATSNNTGNMTIKVNSEVVKSLRNEDGEQLSSGDIEQNKYYKAIYNKSSDFFQLAPKGGGLDDFFGDGSDGILNTSKNITFTSVLNGDAIIKHYESVVINAGHTVTVSNPCQGLIIYCKGDITIRGTINMSKKAGIGTQGNIIPLPITNFKSTSPQGLEQFYKLTTCLTTLKGGKGGNGGNDYSSAKGGIGGVGRISLGGFGGGGAGGDGGDGGSIICAELGGGKGVRSRSYGDAYSGTGDIDGSNGAGGAGGASTSPSSGYSLNASGGVSGDCNGGGGGGTGYTYAGGTSSATGSDAGDGEYAGGYVLIIAGGNVKIEGNIKVNGGNGGSGGSGSSNYGGGGGGGAGGGVINILHKGSYTSSGSLTAYGGSGGGGGYASYTRNRGKPGTSGSSGTIKIQQI